jgi:hypothetical protein
LSSRIIRHTLVVDLETLTLQFRRNSAVSVRRRFQSGFLHSIAQFHFHRSSLARHPPAIETSPAHAGHLTPRIHGLAFRRGLLNFFKQASAPLTTAGG